MKNVDRNTFLNINLKAVKNNYNTIRKKVGNKCIVAATVKANAYGLGAKEIVPTLIDEKCRNFFVATTDEGIELRKLNKDISIYVLNGLIVNDLKILESNNLIPVVNNLDQLNRINKSKYFRNRKLNIVLQFDTGMSRLGLDKKETELFLRDKSKFIKKCNVVLVMSHLACADDKKSKKNKDQLNKFLEIKKYFPNTPCSLSNSAGILLGKQFHFNMVRPGISLYGGNCSLKENNIYENVVTLSSKIIQIREISKNDTVGYGATFKAKSKMTIATLPIGYADGFSRLFSNNYYLLAKNKKIKIVGRVSMDLITVDITKLKNFKNIHDEEIQVIGSKYSINEISKIIGTIPYEILTNLGKRYQRRYIS